MAFKGNVKPKYGGEILGKMMSSFQIKSSVQITTIPKLFLTNMLAHVIHLLWNSFIKNIQKPVFYVVVNQKLVSMHI